MGDTHGEDLWKQIVNQENDKADKIVLVGDYFDSFDVPFEKQMNNFLDIIEYKKANPDKVVLLMGNHDFHYLRQAEGELYSGFQRGKSVQIHKILQEYSDNGTLQQAFSVGDVLVTHAGVTETWMKNNSLTNDKTIASQINKLFSTNPDAFRITGYNPYGDDKREGPFWVRPRSLYLDKAVGWKQVVGHTRGKKISNVDEDVWVIDVLENHVPRYVSTDGKDVIIEQFEYNETV